MLVPRHRLLTVIELARIAAGSEAARAATREPLETALLGLYLASTATARDEFRKRMDPVPQTAKPWAAVELGPALGFATTPPAVTVLVTGQLDDDPDAAEDGNRLPEPHSAAGAPWAPLFAALERWDTPVILAHIGPLGWQLPEPPRVVPLDEGMAVERVPAKAVLSVVPGTSPPTPATPVPPSPPATSSDFWRRPAVLVTGGVVIALASASTAVLATRSTRNEVP